MHSNPITGGPVEPTQPRKWGSEKKIPNKLEKVVKNTISSHDADAKSLTDRSVSEESSEEDLDEEYSRAMADYNALKKKPKSVILEEKIQNPYNRSSQLERQKAFYKTIQPNAPKAPNVRIDIERAKRSTPYDRSPHLESQKKFYKTIQPSAPRVPNVKINIEKAKRPKPLPKRPEIQTEQEESKLFSTPNTVEKSKSKSISTKIRNYFSKDFKWFEK